MSLDPDAVDVVLFDLDGTLTDSGPGITRAVAYALDALALAPLDELALRAFVGPPLVDSFRALNLDDAGVAAAVAAYRVHYLDQGMLDNAVYDGIPEVVAAIAGSGRRVAVATSKPTPVAVRVLEHFGLADAFEAICGSPLDDDGSGARKDLVVAGALATLAVEPGPHAVLVGDRSYDVIGAHRAGIAAVGAGWGYGTRAELSAAGAELIVDDVSALAGWFGLGGQSDGEAFLAGFGA